MAKRQYVAVPYAPNKKHRSARYNVTRTSRGTKLSSKFKSKKNDSRTKTRTKKKSKLIKSPSTGQSNSFTALNFKPMKMLKYAKMTNSPFTFNVVTPFGVNSGMGLQNAVVTNINLYGAMANSTISGVPAIGLGYLGAKSHELQSTVNAPTTFQKSQRFLVNSINTVSEFMNEGSGMINCTVYDLMARNTGSYVDPVSAWSQGLTNTEGLDATSYTCPWTAPTQSKLFNMNWKIVGKRFVELGPGRGHIHTFNHKVNRIVDMEYAQEFNCIKGLTTTCMIVVQGSVADSNNAPALGTITLAPSKLVGISRTKAIVRGMTILPRHELMNNTLALTATNLYNFDEGSGAVIDIANVFG